MREHSDALALAPAAAGVPEESPFPALNSKNAGAETENSGKYFSFTAGGEPYSFFGTRKATAQGLNIYDWAGKSATYYSSPSGRGYRDVRECYFTPLACTVFANASYPQPSCTDDGLRPNRFTGPGDSLVFSDVGAVAGLGGGAAFAPGRVALGGGRLYVAPPLSTIPQRVSAASPFFSSVVHVSLDPSSPTCSGLSFLYAPGARPGPPLACAAAGLRVEFATSQPSTGPAVVTAVAYLENDLVGQGRASFLPYEPAAVGVRIEQLSDTLDEAWLAITFATATLVSAPLRTANYNPTDRWAFAWSSGLVPPGTACRSVAVHQLYLAQVACPPRPGTPLSAGAIVGIAIGGAVVVGGFLFLVIHYGIKRVRARRVTTAAPALGVFAEPATLPEPDAYAKLKGAGPAAADVAAPRAALAGAIPDAEGAAAAL